MTTFVLQGVDAGRWLSRFGLSHVDEQMQRAIAEAFVDVVRTDADIATLRDELPRLPPGVMGMLVLRTNIYVRVRNLSDFRVALFAALLADAVTDSPPAGAFMGLAAEIWANVGRVSDEELELLLKVKRISGQRSMYRHWVEEADILDSYPASEQVDARRRLAELKSKGLMEDGAGQWRAIR